MTSSFDRWNEDGVLDQQELTRLRYELAEANSEIARHHRDFEAIRKILDLCPGHNVMTYSMVDTVVNAIKEIQAIVG